MVISENVLAIDISLTSHFLSTLKRILVGGHLLLICFRNTTSRLELMSFKILVSTMKRTFVVRAFVVNICFRDKTISLEHMTFTLIV